MEVELVTRRGCHLCEEAEAALRQARIQATLLDVDSDPELLRLYDFRVPVLLVDGRIAGEGVIDARMLSRLLQP